MTSQATNISFNYTFTKEINFTFTSKTTGFSTDNTPSCSINQFDIVTPAKTADVSPFENQSKFDKSIRLCSTSFVNAEINKVHDETITSMQPKVIKIAHLSNDVNSSLSNSSKI